MTPPGDRHLDRTRPAGDTELCQKLVRERLYAAACFLLERVGGLRGEFREPSPELSFRNFVASLTGRAAAYARLRKQ